MIDKGVAENMWRVLRDDIVEQWRYEMGTDPDVSEWQVSLYNFYGALCVRFCHQRRLVKLILRHCEDARNSPGEEVAEYVPTSVSGSRYWRRGKFEHGEEGMGRLMIFHLLKHRAPSGEYVHVRI